MAVIHETEFAHPLHPRLKSGLVGTDAAALLEHALNTSHGIGTQTMVINQMTVQQDQIPRWQPSGSWRITVSKHLVTS